MAQVPEEPGPGGASVRPLRSEPAAPVRLRPGEPAPPPRGEAPATGAPAPGTPTPERPPKPSRRSLRGLDGLVFFVANLQTGFGPFVAVYLTSQKWTQVDIGLVLTIGSVVGLLGQIPGGALVDRAKSKRLVAAICVGLVGLSAVGLGLGAAFPIILFAWLLHAAASCPLGPAINAITLGLVGHARLAQRLGRNASFQSIGAAIAAAGMGAVGTYLSNQAVFFVTAVLMAPALYALWHIPRVRTEQAIRDSSPEAEEGPSLAGWAAWRDLLKNRPLLVLSVAMLLFHLANAAMLPLLGSVMTVRSNEAAALLIAACIIVPQVVVAILSPAIGLKAQSWGRRPLLLIGFAALPVRALVFGLVRDPVWLVAAQILDGIAAAALGVLMPLVIADATRKAGHFALMQGVVGTGMGIGAAASTLLAGFVADRLGSSTAFLGLAGLACLGFVVVAAWMPETLPRRGGASRTGATS